MTKIIEIDNCKECKHIYISSYQETNYEQGILSGCPEVSYPRVWFYMCSHPDADHGKVDETTDELKRVDIPDWCPLEGLK